MAALVALGEASGYIAAFVGAVYAFPSTRTMDEKARDSAGVVARRCISIMALAGGCVYLTALRRGVPTSRVIEGMLVGETNAAAMAHTLTGPQHSAALITETAASALKGLSVTVTLFAGVILNHVLDAAREIVADAKHRIGGDGSAGGIGSVLAALPSEVFRYNVVAPIQAYLANPGSVWPDLRNYVVCPVAEEIVLRYMPIDALERACLCVSGGYAPGCVLTRFHRAAFCDPAVAALAKAGRLPEPSWTFHLLANPRRRMGWSALLFASSHAHHYFRYHQTAHEAAKKRMASADAGRFAQKRALQSLMASMLITGTFGMLSSWILLRRADGSVVAPLASHSLCNFLGPPSLAFLGEERRTLRPAVSGGAKVVPAWFVALERVAITAAHVGGIAGFFAMAAGYW